MLNPPMYSFVIEEVSAVKVGHILNQALIFAHDEDDAIGRHAAMYPDAVRGKDVTFRVFPYIQSIQVVGPSVQPQNRDTPNYGKGKDDG